MLVLNFIFEKIQDLHHYSFDASMHFEHLTWIENKPKKKDQ